ncbi:MAG: hypothetical protein K2X47_11065, partial [Bdellovibrionales bacterium]|nr:hypothetical protein [Bdellovibrionales bacterium]
MKNVISSLISVIFSVPFSAALLMQIPFPESVFAQSSSFTYEGRLFSSSGIPVLDSVDVKFQILNPAGNCVLYEEV